MGAKMIPTSMPKSFKGDLDQPRGRRGPIVTAFCGSGGGGGSDFGTCQVPPGWWQQVACGKGLSQTCPPGEGNSGGLPAGLSQPVDPSGVGGFQSTMEATRYH